MDLKTTLTNDMKAAMKSHEAVKLGCIRMLLSEIKKREIDKKSPLDEAEIHKAISSLLKQRVDSVEAFEKGGRQDLADKERAEIAVLKAYMPEQMSAADTEKLVVAAIQEIGAASPADIGKVMKAALAKAGGKADNKLINEFAKKLLTPK